MSPSNTSTESDPGHPVSETTLDTVTEAVSNRGFSEWYDERQIEQNLLDGKPYFNGPSPPKPPDRHTPSRLLQCHRKAMYARQNAPREGTTNKMDEKDEQWVEEYRPTFVDALEERIAEGR